MIIPVHISQSLHCTILSRFRVSMSAPSTGDSPGERGEDPNKQRQSNLQRIQQRKQSVREWPKDKKMEKLAIYSSCKEDESCKCNGWKNPNPPPNPPRPDAPQPTSSPSDPCRTCGHALSSHVSHLSNAAEDELDRLLGIVVDVENLFMCVHKEEDQDTKQVYFYLFKLLRRCILQTQRRYADLRQDSHWKDHHPRG